MTRADQLATLAVTGIILAGTLALFVVQFIRRYGRKHDDR